MAKQGENRPPFLSRHKQGVGERPALGEILMSLHLAHPRTYCGCWGRGANAWGPEGLLAGLLCLGHVGLEGRVLVRAHHSSLQPT